MKKLIFLASLFVAALSFNACSPAYVRVQPTYSPALIPVRPSANHTWVNGNWNWNSRNRSYTQQNGYWIAPRRGRTYTQGYWQTNQRGHRWVSGRWR